MSFVWNSWDKIWRQRRRQHPGRVSPGDPRLASLETVRLEDTWIERRVRNAVSPETLGALVALTPRDILKTRGCGRKALTYLNDELEQLGLSLAPESEPNYERLAEARKQKRIASLERQLRVLRGEREPAKLPAGGGDGES